MATKNQLLAKASKMNVRVVEAFGGDYCIELDAVNQIFAGYGTSHGMTASGESPFDVYNDAWSLLNYLRPCEGCDDDWCGLDREQTNAKLGRSNDVALVVPERFFEDHFQRQLVNDSFTCVSKGNRLAVTLSFADAEELMSDALYYALGNMDDMDDNGLVTSARYTVRALVRQGLHDYHTRDHSEVRLINKYRAEMGMAEQESI
jgi:hypothetical protein